MAYENVNTTKLKNALNAAELSTKKLKDLKGSFNSSKWDSVAREKVKKAIDDLISLYNNCNNTIDQAATIRDKIKEVKDLQDKNETYTGYINYWKKHDVNDDGTPNEYAKERIRYYQNKKDNNKTKIRTLTNQIENFL